MKTKEHLDLLIDNETKVGRGYPTGHPERKAFESRVTFLKECKMILLAMDAETIRKQLDLTVIKLGKYQAQKK